MASLLENMGCSLEALPPKTPVLHQKWQYRAAARPGIKSMVRAAMPYSPRGGSLDRLLRTADEQFQDVAARCGAEVVRHEWALYVPGPGSPLAEYFSPLVPRDHILVARVDVIQNGHPVTDEQANSIHGANWNFFQDNQHLPAIWYDGNRPEQYLNGELPGEQETKLVMIDPEPRLDIPVKQIRRFLPQGPSGI